MKIILLGNQEKTGFVSELEKHCTIEWKSKPEEAIGECAYIIIMERDVLLSDQLRRFLLKQGFEEDKILEYCFFEKSPPKSQIELFQQKYCQNDFDSFWFGMSHSYSGLLEEVLTGKKLYKFSAPSMDLYYHFQLLNCLETMYDMGKIRKIYFELPYYAFNYDVSRCSNVFEQRINFFYYLQDYHHFGHYPDQKRRIYMFEKLSELTGNAFYRTFQNAGTCAPESKLHYKIGKLKRKSYYTFCKKERHDWTEAEISRVEQLQPHVWYKERAATVEENRQIWDSILAWAERYPWIQPRVVIFPFCPYFINANREVIDARKKEFMDNIVVDRDQVTDMFDAYLEHPEYFDDECHLNFSGAYHFTKKINCFL